MSQVDFFMLGDDEQDFLDFLWSRSDTHVFAGRFFRTTHPAAIRALPDVPDLHEFSLVNSTLCPDPVCSVACTGKDRGLYTFALHGDPHIEFSRSRIVEGLLRPGRIYAKIGWLEVPEHNPVFRSWYSAIERWLKKRYTRHRKHWWFGPQARRWSLDGGSVAYGPYPSTPLVETLRDPKPV